MNFSEKRIRMNYWRVPAEKKDQKDINDKRDEKTKAAMGGFNFRRNFAHICKLRD